jgi:hypothetical protein
MPSPPPPYSSLSSSHCHNCPSPPSPPRPRASPVVPPPPVPAMDKVTRPRRRSGRVIGDEDLQPRWPHRRFPSSALPWCVFNTSSLGPCSTPEPNAPPSRSAHRLQRGGQVGGFPLRERHREGPRPSKVSYPSLLRPPPSPLPLIVKSECHVCFAFHQI